MSVDENGADGAGRQRVASFSVWHERFLDEAGCVCAPLPDFARNVATLRELYRAMVLTRTFDEKAVALQRTGRLGTFASSLGQEAVGVGLASAMRPDDVLVPSFREHGAQLVRGVSLLELLSFWGGHARGSDFAGPRGDFPISVPVASHVLHAAGVAFALQMRGESRAALCVCGDGATSKGDFYEAINVAGAWRLPAVFVVVNNGWAISVPRAAQTAAQTLAQKAFAGGIDGVQVDGNDVVAGRHAVGRAREHARGGEGASLVEALTYRLSDHTTADDASRYRDDDEVSIRWHAEPVARLRHYLVESAGWSREDEEQLLESVAAQIEAAAEAYLAVPPEQPESMFDYLYETLPVELQAQRASLAAGRAEGPGDE
jgi:pyruvate dehydrogenase E1 component alpha subunit